MEKDKSFAILLITLAIMSVFLFHLPSVEATDMGIIFVSPENHYGNVGEEVRLVGTINTTEGLSRIWFGDCMVNETHAVGNVVDVTFLVPSLPEGNYTIILHDDATRNNATTWFYVETAYHITPELLEGRRQFQQGDSVDLHLNLTGGKQDTVYWANITVVLPNPLNTSYSAMIEFTDTVNTGYAEATITYPDDILFDPHGSCTNYTGVYSVFFNKTQDLAEDSFFIGLTNSSDYHREEIMDIRALGYQQNETVNIVITFLGTNKTLPSIVVNASEQGLVNAIWMVPLKASIGDYNLEIVSEVTTKPIHDSQIFSIPGYQIDVYVQNLAGDAVRQIKVEALDNATNIRYNATSDWNGFAHLWLERGPHKLEAFWNEVKVNETQINVNEKETHNLTCELTNVKITVKDKNEILIPFAHLNVSFQYVTTRETEVKKDSVTGETNIFGVFYLNSTLPHITYIIDAFRYEKSFNSHNNTIEDLQAEKWYNVSVLCPTKNLTLNITDHHHNPLANARVNVIEQMGGIQYSEIADSNGIAIINCTFGKYKVKAYTENLLLTETLVDVFNDTNIEVYCKLSNLTLSVKVVDYIGQPIPLANVTLHRNGIIFLPDTESYGLIKFASITGGNMEIMVYIRGYSQPCVTKSLFLDRSTTIEIKMEKYVMLAVFLVETNYLITALLILATIILILSIEIYRRKHLTSKKASS